MGTAALSVFDWSSDSVVEMPDVRTIYSGFCEEELKVTWPDFQEPNDAFVGSAPGLTVFPIHGSLDSAVTGQSLCNLGDTLDVALGEKPRHSEHVERAIDSTFGPDTELDLVSEWTTATLLHWSSYSVGSTGAHGAALHNAARELCEVDGVRWLPREPLVDTRLASFRDELSSLVALWERDENAPIDDGSRDLEDSAASPAAASGARPAVSPRACEGRTRTSPGSHGGRRTGTSSGAGSGGGSSDDGGGGGSDGPGEPGEGEPRPPRRRWWEGTEALAAWVGVGIAALALVTTIVLAFAAPRLTAPNPRPSRAFPDPPSRSVPMSPVAVRPNRPASLLHWGRPLIRSREASKEQDRE